MVALRAVVTLRAERTTGSNGGLDQLVFRFSEKAGSLPYNFVRRVQKYARAKAPVRTGYLKSSITRTRLGLRSHRLTVNAYYGRFVNYGTRYMRAQPFWEPAIRQARRDLKKDMRKVLHG